MENKVIILRAIPGQGKTTIAQILANGSEDSTIISADHFFMEGGVYVFDPQQIGHAHAWCKVQFTNALAESTELIIVDNTNTTLKEYSYYKAEGLKAGYKVFELIVGNLNITTSEERNTHNVPRYALVKMARRFYYPAEE